MSRYRRVHVPGGLYFFTVVTHEREPWFEDAPAVAALGVAMRKVRATRPFATEAVVLLPDHMHCIWRLPPGDADFSSRWREIKKATTHLIAPNCPEPLVSVIWQRRFWEHCLRDEQDWRRHMDYIHYNPVKHGYVRRPEEWPWSSYQQAVAKGWYQLGWGDSEPEALPEQTGE